MAAYELRYHAIYSIQKKLPLCLCADRKFAREHITVTRSPRRVWGHPNEHFRGAKIASVIHLPCLPLTRSPRTPAKKAGGVRSYVSDLSRALRMPSATPP